MALTLRTVPFGPPAVELLGALVGEAKRPGALAPVTVVVADNVSGVAARRALAARGGIAAVGFVTMHRLAEQLGGPRLASAGRRPVSPPVVAAAVRSVLEAEPGRFAPVRTHAATEQALVRLHRELGGVSRAALEALAATGPRGAEAVRVCTAVRRALAGGWFDEADLLEAAAAEIAERGHGVVESLGHVIVHLPRVLGRPEAILLTAIAHAGDVTVVMGATGDDAADRFVREAATQLGVAVELPDVTPAPAARIVSVSDPDEEVRAAVHELSDAMRSGTALGRTAILWGTAEPYARLVHEQLEAAAIPHNGAAVRTIGDALLGRTIRGLLALPDNDFRRSDVLGLLACNHIVGADGRRVPSRRWERVSRDAGVIDGDDWEVRLDAFAARDDARALEAEAGGEERRAAAMRRDAGHARALQRFVRDLRAALDAAGTITTWAGFVDWACGLLRTYLGDEQRRTSWPDEEQQAAVRVEEALDRLRGLDGAGVRSAPTLELFRRSLDSELAASAKRVGRFGDGVLVAHVRTASGLLFDRAVVLGMAEGLFPARRQEDPLLPDVDRQATGGEVSPRADRIDDDHRALLAVLAGAAHATLTFPRGDLRRRGDRTASRWLLDSVRALAGGSLPVFTDELHAFRHEPWFHEAPSHVAELAARAFPTTTSEYDVASLLRAGVTGSAAADHPTITGDPVSRAGVELLLARAGSAFTRFDGNLAGRGLTLPSPAEPGTVTSPTRLEAWARCPHGYLMEHVLGVEVPADPEREHEMGPLDLGSLVHEVLESFLRENVGREWVGWTHVHRQRLRTLGVQVCDAYEARGRTGRAVFWRRDRARILRDLDRWLDEDTRRDPPWRVPLGAERPFGMCGERPVELRLPDGRTIAMRGQIDRVDQAADGAVIVVDYKTGSTRNYEGLGPGDPVARGTRLQLPVYAAAARAAFGTHETPVHAAYWFVSTKGDWSWIGYDVTGDVVDHASRTLAAIVAGIEGGVFPARPNLEPPYTYVDCHFCDPDGLGTGDRRREWERKRYDQALAPYAALAEPETS